MAKLDATLARLEAFRPMLDEILRSLEEWQAELPETMTAAARDEAGKRLVAIALRALDIGKQESERLAGELARRRRKGFVNFLRGMVTGLLIAFAIEAIGQLVLW